MDTAEARSGVSASEAPIYDGFMSYSHAADDLLAPRLQASLQRFAKPWWKRRALRVFRDEASLSANPHLWSSITEALDDSGWFVLLLSPDAAESPWVNREVEYWLAHRDSDRIIPVLTEGNFGWLDGDVVSDAAPPALQGAFSDEPRWVDLRFARSEEQLDLGNPRFSAAVADIASALRDIPKDELESEEVKQHRRTIRTAWTAGIALALLLVLASAAAVFAVGQRNEARESERIAFARELAAASVANLEVDPERSVLLATEAVNATRSVDGVVLPEAEEALHRAVQASRVELVVPSGGAAVFSPDGRRIVGGGPSDVPVWSATSGDQDLILVGHSSRVFNAAYSADGTRIATNANDLAQRDGGTTRVWAADTGEQLQVIPQPAGVIGVEISPDSQLLATSYGDFEAIGGVHIRDLHTGAVLQELDSESPLGMSFSSTGLLAVAAAGVDVWDVETGELVINLPAEVTDVAFSPDGSFLVTDEGVSATVWNTSTWERRFQLFGHHGAIQGLAVSDDGTLIASGSNDGTARVYDALTGEPLLTLSGHVGAVINVDFGPDGRQLVTGGADDTTRVWNIDLPAGGELLTIRAPVIDLDYSPDGGTLAAGGFVVGLWDAATGSGVRALEGHEAPIRRIQFGDQGNTILTAGFDFSVRLWATDTGREVLRLDQQRVQGGGSLSPSGTTVATAGEDGFLRTWDATSGQELDAVDAHNSFLMDVEFSPDGSLIATSARSDGSLKLWDAASLGSVWQRFEHGGFDPTVAQVDFSPDGLLVASASWDGTAKIWDVPSGEVVTTLSGHTGEVWAVDFSPDGSRVATGGGDGTVRVWDVETGETMLVLSVSTLEVVSVEFSPDGSQLATAGFDDTLRVWALDIDDLLAVAGDRVTRSLTDDECRQYLHVEACPNE